jgi:hypothetical protein
MSSVFDRNCIEFHQDHFRGFINNFSQKLSESSLLLKKVERSDVFG